MFFFNFNGYSGKFYFGDDRTPYLVPEQDIKIEYDYPGDYAQGTWTTSPGLYSGGGYCIMSFTITTPDGTKYYFGAHDPVTSFYCDPIEVTSTFTLSMGSSYSQVISSWFLQKIVSSDGNHVVTFNYKRDKFSTFAFTNPPRGFAGNSGPLYAMVKNFVAGVKLDNIQSSLVNVSFLPGIVRKDVSSWTGNGIEQNLVDYDNSTSLSVGGIQVNNLVDNLCIKKYNFLQSHFHDATTALPPVIASTIMPRYPDDSLLIYDTYKLRLNSIQQVSCDGSTTVPPYTFTYFQEPVPRLFSMGRDHWGFYNGVTTNQSLFPSSLTYLNYNFSVELGISLANRTSSWPAMRAGTLNKITYPTGGTTTFDFEANTFAITKVVNNQIVPVDTTVGGLRIKTISNYDPVTNTTTATNYSYTSDSSTFSSGLLFSQPTYVQLFRNAWMAATNFAGTHQGCWDPYNPNGTNDFVYSDNPIRPMNTTQGNHIGYSQVTVSQSGNGRSVYKYFGSTNHDLLAVTSITNPPTLDTSVPNYPPAPPPNDFMRGELSYEGHYNDSGTILSEKFHTPSFAMRNISTPGRLYVQWGALGAETVYELFTGHKTEQKDVENNYQTDGTVQSQTTQTYYQSNYHHQPTSIATTTSDGKTYQKQIKYSFDLTVPAVDTVSDCTSKYRSSLYINYSQLVLGDPDNNAGVSLQQIFNSSTGYTDTSYARALSQYYKTLTTDRYNFINCRRTKFTNTSPLNNYQTYHNTAKAMADNLLGPVLWAQDDFINVPVETTELINGKLVASTYTQYSNTRGDAFGVYPQKSMKIDLSNLSSAFTPVSVNTGGTSIVKDGRYLDDTHVEFSKGQVLNVVGRNEVPTSYDWGFNNNYPTVKAVNASNNAVESAVPTHNTFSFSLSNSTPASSTFSFTQNVAGTMTVSIPQSVPPGASVSATVSIVGPANQNSISLNTGGNPSVSFYNMPSGQYTLTYSVTTSFTSYAFGYSLTFSYQTLSTSVGIKEFFFDGFEENSDSRVVTGVSHTGNKYWNSSYTTTYTKPNSRNYIIQWWNLANGQWQFNQQSYSNGMTLTWPVDDVRIFPADAQVTSYNYEPGLGITSQMDTNGVVSYYNYDNLGRLSTITDQNHNIIKNYRYNYYTSPARH